MALVLTFSVQGIADALTFGTTRTGDLQTVFRGSTSPATDSLFTLEFDVTLTNRKLKNSAYRVIPSNAGEAYDPDTTYYYDSSMHYIGTAPDPNTNGLTALRTNDRISESEAYYYNDQAVTINPPSNIRLVRIGSYNVATASITLSQTGTWPDGRTRLTSGRIRATFAAPTSAGTAGRHEIFRNGCDDSS